MNSLLCPIAGCGRERRQVPVGFGPDTRPVEFCFIHDCEWLESGEWRRHQSFERGHPARRAALADFVNRVEAEERNGAR